MYSDQVSTVVPTGVFQGIPACWGGVNAWPGIEVLPLAQLATTQLRLGFSSCDSVNRWVVSRMAGFDVEVRKDWNQAILDNPGGWAIDLDFVDKDERDRIVARLLDGRRRCRIAAVCHCLDDESAAELRRRGVIVHEQAIDESVFRRLRDSGATLDPRQL